MHCPPEERTWIARVVKTKLPCGKNSWRLSEFMEEQLMTFMRSRKCRKSARRIVLNIKPRANGIRLVETKGRRRARRTVLNDTDMSIYWKQSDDTCVTLFPWKNTGDDSQKYRKSVRRTVLKITPNAEQMKHLKRTNNFSSYREIIEWDMKPKMMSSASERRESSLNPQKKRKRNDVISFRKTRYFPFVDEALWSSIRGSRDYLRVWRRIIFRIDFV